MEVVIRKQWKMWRVNLNVNKMEVRNNKLEISEVKINKISKSI